jgi:hypothetical protein
MDQVHKAHKIHARKPNNLALNSRKSGLTTENLTGHHPWRNRAKDGWISAGVTTKTATRKYQRDLQISPPAQGTGSLIITERATPLFSTARRLCGGLIEPRLEVTAALFPSHIDDGTHIVS